MTYHGEVPSPFVPNPGEGTCKAEMMGGGPWDGQIHEVNTTLTRIRIPGQGSYIRQERQRHTTNPILKPARVFRWKSGV